MGIEAGAHSVERMLGLLLTGVPSWGYYLQRIGPHPDRSSTVVDFPFLNALVQGRVPMAGLIVTGLVALGILGGACSGPSRSAAEESRADSSTDSTGAAAADTLTSIQRQKLDHALMLLLREGSDNPVFDYQVRSRGDSVATYGVLIRANDPAALAASALALGDGESTIVTAFLTVKEIRRAARLEAVTSIANPSRAELH